MPVLCAETILIAYWLVGDRSGNTGKIFVIDLASRLKNRVQIKADGHEAYLEAVEGVFGSEVDYTQLVEVDGAAPGAEKRYSPPECIGAHKDRIAGKPDRKHVICREAEFDHENVDAEVHEID
ncbi:MAG: hypothetical protein QF902_12245 [Rhodospirillales bacterium]|jgi:hypothetical protein|nr:hypothetical protein [Rhodospirillales bacterium]